MRRLSLVQIGDLHYPEHRDPFGTADIAGAAGMSPELALVVAQSRLKAPAEALHGVIARKASLRAILLCGDLTSRGDATGYKSAVSFLQSLLNGTDLWSAESLTVVPGNHDVDRFAHSPEAPEARFSSLRAAWEDAGLPVIATDAVQKLALDGGGGAGVSVLSLNSCLGCGETWTFPEEIRDELSDLLESYVKDRGDLAAAFELVGEQLDTPAIHSDHVDEVVREIGTLGAGVVPLVLAHHNLLPQPVPRFTVYTEMLNAGLARLHMARTDRSVVYCHGHIHQFAVELISRGDAQDVPLIAISAPTFAEGFNYLEFQFSNEGTPLGLEVVEYRRLQGVAVTAGEATRIPLVRDRDRRRVREELDQVILGCFGERSVLRFHDLHAAVQSKQSTRTRQNTLAERLQELEWLELVAIRKRNEEPKYWQVERRL